MKPYISILGISLTLFIGSQVDAQARVDPIAVGTPGNGQQGKIQLSGGDFGCVELVHQRVIVPYRGSFSPPPDFEAAGTVNDANDHLVIEQIERKSDRAVVTVSSHGLDGRPQVCAPTFIAYTVEAEPQ